MWIVIDEIDEIKKNLNVKFISDIYIMVSWYSSDWAQIGIFRLQHPIQKLIFFS